jgi:hypothetical protein
LGLLLPACLVDLDDRCGKNEHYDAALGICACDAEYALIGSKCEACAEHEVGSPDGCVCAAGFVRPQPDAVCQALAGLGQDCQADADCGDEDYGYCRLETGSDAGYCTARDCDGSVGCPGDYSCNTRQSPSFCEHPPSGLGQACSSSDDCAGNTASYCETVVAKSCVVSECAPDPSKCYGDWVCCDIGLLSQSLCVPPSELENGNCPAGGTLIPREGG